MIARFTPVEPALNERSRRLLVGAEAKTAGFGGITATSLATGVSRSTIGRGLKDLAVPGSLSGDVRRPGGGGPTLIEKDPTLPETLRHVVEPATMGDPKRPLMWVSKKAREAGVGLARNGSQGGGQQYPQIAGLAEIPASGEPQDFWRAAITRPERTIRTHQRRGDRQPGGWPAGDFDRHEEEGADRKL